MLNVSAEDQKSGGVAGGVEGRFLSEAEGRFLSEAEGRFLSGAEGSGGLLSNFPNRITILSLF